MRRELHKLLRTHTKILRTFRCKFSNEMTREVQVNFSKSHVWYISHYNKWYKLITSVSSSLTLFIHEITGLSW